MVRSTFVGWIVIGLGCTLTPADGMGGAFGESDSGQPTAETGGEASESTASAPDTSSGGEEGSTAGTFDPLDGSSGAGPDAESGGAESTGAATTAATTGAADDPGGAYAACETNDDCGMDPPGLACLSADENGAGGFCSPPCGTYGATPPDPNLCPDSPAGVAATVVCLEGLVRNCALACRGDADCPDGTACLMANNGGGPYCFGL